MTTKFTDLTPAQRKAAARLWGITNRVGPAWLDMKTWRQYANANTPTVVRVAELAKDGIEFASRAVLWCRHTSDLDWARGYDGLFPSMTPGYLFLAQRAGEPEPA